MGARLELYQVPRLRINSITKHSTATLFCLRRLNYTYIQYIVSTVYFSRYGVYKYDSITREDGFERLRLSGKKTSPSGQRRLSTSSTRASPSRAVLDASPQSVLNMTAKLPPRKEDDGQVKSMWDADDDEFDRWPGRKTLERITKNFASQRGIVKSTKSRSTKSPTASIIRKVSENADEMPRICGTNLTLQEHDDMMHELADMNCGNPHGSDIHDEVMRQFWSRSHLSLPAWSPARWPHILNVKAYKDRSDTITQSAHPRLCDAVVTILYLTSPKCLVDFLNPTVKVFEWRRDGNCLMIRRQGNHIIVGTYHNFGTRYLWTYFVRSSVSYTGAWTEVYAATTQGSTPISDAGVRFDQFEAEPNSLDIDPTDEKFALYVGRGLAWFLLKWEVWNYRYWRQYNVE
ncbi:Nn.00g088590.m01.CDS01 [Neocucurbitaria sp. VM-36]